MPVILCSGLAGPVQAAPEHAGNAAPITTAIDASSISTMRIVSITRRFLLMWPLLRTGCYGTSRSARPYRILLIFAEIAMGSPDRFHFGRFTLEVAVTHGTTVIHHSPKAFDVLVLLGPAGWASRDEERSAVAGLAGCLCRSRHSDHLHRGAAKAFGDDKRASAFIETVPRSGYRFVAPVQQAHVKGDRVAESRHQRIPSIAVLPPVNLSADPEQEYFVEGMTER